MQSSQHEPRECRFESSIFLMLSAGWAGALMAPAESALGLPTLLGLATVYSDASKLPVTFCIHRLN